MKIVKKSSRKVRPNTYLLYNSLMLNEEDVDDWNIWINRKDIHSSIKMYITNTRNFYRVKVGLICIFLFKELNRDENI